MNILPQPNYFNRTISGGNYNYQIQEVQTDPKTQPVAAPRFRSLG